jgi:hypothetical protein
MSRISRFTQGFPSPDFPLVLGELMPGRLRRTVKPAPQGHRALRGCGLDSPTRLGTLAGKRQWQSSAALRRSMALGYVVPLFAMSDNLLELVGSLPRKLGQGSPEGFLG